MLERCDGGACWQVWLGLDLLPGGVLREPQLRVELASHGRSCWKTTQQLLQQLQLKLPELATRQRPAPYPGIQCNVGCCFGVTHLQRPNDSAGITVVCCQNLQRVQNLTAYTHIADSCDTFASNELCCKHEIEYGWDGVTVKATGFYVNSV